MTTNENSSEAPLTWTSSDEWGTVGRTHRAEVTLDNGDTWKFVVDQPRKGVWLARGWRNGVFAMYREDRTMKGAKAQSQAQANRAATQTCTTCREIGGHKLDCSAVLPVPADAARHATVPAPVIHSVPVDELTTILADERTARYVANYSHGSATIEQMADAGRAAVAALSAVTRNINLWTNRRRPAGCSCPTPTHRMSCGHGARPKVVQKRTPRRFGVTGSRVVLVSVDQ